MCSFKYCKRCLRYCLMQYGQKQTMFPAKLWFILRLSTAKNTINLKTLNLYSIMLVWLLLSLYSVRWWFNPVIQWEDGVDKLNDQDCSTVFAILRAPLNSVSVICALYVRSWPEISYKHTISHLLNLSKHTHREREYTCWLWQLMSPFLFHAQIFHSVEVTQGIHPPEQKHFYHQSVLSQASALLKHYCDNCSDTKCFVKY